MVCKRYSVATKLVSSYQVVCARLGCDRGRLLHSNRQLLQLSSYWLLLRKSYSATTVHKRPATTQHLVPTGLPTQMALTTSYQQLVSNQVPTIGQDLGRGPVGCSTQSYDNHPSTPACQVEAKA